MKNCFFFDQTDQSDQTDQTDSIKKSLLIIFLLLFFLDYPLYSVPEEIVYQGRLLDSTGNVINNPSVPMKFLIYSDLTGGTLLYQDWHDGSAPQCPLVSVQDGLYKVIIGDDHINHAGTEPPFTSLSEALQADDSVYLEIIVDGNTLSPRERLYSVPFALSCGSSSDSANKALSNLSSVAVNTNILPGIDNTIDIGSFTKTWKDIYLKGNVYVKGNISDGINSMPVSDIVTLAGTQTLTNKTINPANNTIALDNSKILIGNASNTAAPQTVSGDITINNAGVSTIQANAVDTIKIANSAVTTAKIADKNVTLAKLADGGPNQVYTTNASGVAQLENKSIFVSSTLPQNQIFVGNASNVATATTNLPIVTMPTGGNWTLSSNLNIDSNTLVVDQANDRVGIGTASPTAALQLKAGTATANTAPLKFTAGTNLTTPENGAIEYDGTNLYFTPSGTRKTFAFLNESNFAPRNFSYFFDEFDTILTITTVRMCGLNWLPANSGTGAGQTVLAVTPADNCIGILRLSTGTTTTGYASIYRGANDGFLCGLGEFTFEARVRINTLSSTTEEYAFAIGLHDSTTKNAIDGVYFLYDRATYPDGFWRCVTSSNSTRTTNNSNTSVTTNWVRLKCVVNATGTSAAFYINDTLVATNNSNIPTATGRTTAPRILIIKSSGTTARTVDVDYWYHQIKFTNAR